MPEVDRPRVFVTRVIPDDGIALLRAHCDVEVWSDPLPPPPEALHSFAQCVDGVLALPTDMIDGALMDTAGPNLRVISNMAVGVDNINVVDATARGIPVGNTPGVLTETSADFAFALLMAAARRVVEADAYTRSR